MRQIPLYKNIVINGETNIVQIIPEGLKNPKAEIETGAVNVTALTEAEREPEILGEKIFVMMEVTGEDKKRMPAKAPYESRNPRFVRS